MRTLLRAACVAVVLLVPGLGQAQDRCDILKKQLVSVVGQSDSATKRWLADAVAEGCADLTVEGLRPFRKEYVAERDAHEMRELDILLKQHVARRGPTAQAQSR